MDEQISATPKDSPAPHCARLNAAAALSIEQQRDLVDLKLRRVLLWLARLALFATIVTLVILARPLVTTTLDVLSPFIVAFIVAYVFNPLVRTLQYRLKMGRMLAVGLTYLLILSIAGAFFSLLVPVVYTQARNAVFALFESIPIIAQRLSEWFQINVSEDDVARIRNMFEAGGDVQALKTVTPLGNWMVGMFGNMAQWSSRMIVTLAAGTVGGATFLAFVLMISAYFLLDYTGMWRRIEVIIPKKNHDRVVGLSRKIDRALGGYLRGQITVCCIMAVLYTLALMALGLKSYAVLIGLLAGFGNLIPYFGPLIGAVPTLLWIVFSDYYGTPETKCFAAIAVLGLTVVLQSLDGWIFQPRIVGANADLPPLLVLFALIIGAQFGLVGMVLAVPSAVIARVLLVELWWNPLLKSS